MLRLEHVHLQKQGKKILNDIQLRVAQGEKLLIRGPSGAGKSTLLKVLFCFERFSGDLLFSGDPVVPSTLSEYRSHLGFISQRLPSFDAPAVEVLRFPFHFRVHRHRRFPEKRSRELMEALRFSPDLLNQPFSDLSGGEKQRLLVLQLLLIDRPVFLLDEVTAALDPENIETVIRLLTATPQRTVISVSHNQEWGRYCSRTLVMQSGSFQEEK